MTFSFVFNYKLQRCKGDFFGVVRSQNMEQLAYKANKPREIGFQACGICFLTEHIKGHFHHEILMVQQGGIFINSQYFKCQVDEVD